jgi:hypothetical protein
VLETILESRGLQKIEKDNVISIVSTKQPMRQWEGVKDVIETLAKQIPGRRGAMNSSG